jgi:hypothetical protein
MGSEPMRSFRMLDLTDEKGTTKPTVLWAAGRIWGPGRLNCADKSRAIQQEVFKTIVLRPKFAPADPGAAIYVARGAGGNAYGDAPGSAPRPGAQADLSDIAALCWNFPSGAAHAVRSTALSQ